MIQVQIPLEMTTQTHKGFGFVEFELSEDALGLLLLVVCVVYVVVICLYCCLCCCCCRHVMIGLSIVHGF